MLQFFSPFSGMKCRRYLPHLEAVWLAPVSPYLVRCYQQVLPDVCLFFLSLLIPFLLYSMLWLNFGKKWMFEKPKKEKKEPHKTNKTKVITRLSNHFVPHFYTREKQLVMSILYPSYSFKKYFGLGWVSQLFEASSHIPNDCGFDPLLCTCGR